MPRIALIGLAGPAADLVEPALTQEAFDVTRIPLDADTVRTLARAHVDAAVVDGHPYVQVGALMADIRGQADIARLPVVLLSSGELAEVPQFEVVTHLGRSLDLDQLVATVRRVAAPVAE